MQQIPHYPGPYPKRPRPRLVVGLAVSVLVHIVLLALIRAPVMPAPQDERRWTRLLTIRLLPPRPVPLPEPLPQPITAPATKPAAIRPARQPVATPQPNDAAVEASAPAPITVFPAEPIVEVPAIADGEPKFDREVARKAIRGMYDQVKPPATNWVAEKLNKDKEWKETKFERFGKAVANSARADCRTAYQGAGLLAPLAMLADKKNGGCKF